VAKDKGKELRKYRVEKTRERRAKEKIQRVQRLAEGNSCGLSADEGRYWRLRAGRSAEPSGGSPELLRFPLLREEVVCARLGGRG